MKKKVYVGLIVLLTVVGIATTAVCMPQWSTINTYYSDATHSVIVGEYCVTCLGQVLKWGIRTPYVDRVYEPCFRP
jgi:hypothetical protein